MQKYIQNLIPRLRAYGKQLNKIEEFVDKTWVLEDKSGIFTYRFKRNGVLRKTINGDIQDLRWELEGTDAISIIDPVSHRGEMFRHGFVLDGLLIVQKEGTRSMPIIFYNEAVVTDGDVAEYLLNAFIRKENLQRVEDSKGYFYKRSSDTQDISVGSEVYSKDLSPIEYDIIKLRGKTIYIEQGKIKSIIYHVKIKADVGYVNVSSSNIQVRYGSISVGDNVSVNGNSYFSGKIRLESGGIVTVQEGLVLKVTFSNKPLMALGVLVILILVFVGFLLHKGSKKVDDIHVVNEDVNVDTAAAAVDTNAAVVDTSTVNFFELNPEKERQLKERIVGYFEMINKRDWSQVKSLFANSVYYFNAQLAIDEIESKLDKYWGSMSMKAGVYYESSNIKLSSDNNKYLASINIVEEAEKGIYKVPYIYASDMTFELNNNSQIQTINSAIIENKPYFQRMFGLSTEISLEDYRLRNRESDWISIFNKLQDIAGTTPSVFNEYFNTVIDIYGESCYVQVNDTLYSLKDYMRKIQTGQLRFNSVLSVRTENFGKTIKVY